MSIYRYPDSSWIKEVTFRYISDVAPIALLSPSADATPDQLSVVRAAIDLQGWQSVPVTLDGKDMLQVSGFAQAKDMHLFLRDHEFIAGLPQLVPDAEEKKLDTPKPKSFLELYSLQLAGVLNLIGDIGFLGSGIKTRDPSKIAGGALYTLGGANLAAFGGTRPDHAMSELTEDTADLLRDRLGKLPEDSALAKAETHKKTGTFSDTLYDNAAQNTLGIYTAGAGAMLASGIKKYHEGKGSKGLYYGISSLVFKVASFMIPEKTKADKSKPQKRQGAIGRMVEWIHEKPLRLFGGGSVITDVFLTLDSYSDYKRDPKNKSYYWSAVTAATYIMADLMIAMSNKDHHNAEGKLTVDAQRSVEAMAAEAIANQPESARNDLITQVSAFLADQPNTTGSVDDFKKSLTEQVSSFSKNRWAQRVTQQSNDTQQPSLQ